MVCVFSFLASKVLSDCIHLNRYVKRFAEKFMPGLYAASSDLIRKLFCAGLSATQTTS